MAKLKYPVIKNRAQYNAYCNALEELLSKPKQSKEEEIELLTTLIEVWDQQHSLTRQLDPIQLLRSFIKEHKLKPLEIMKIMGIQSRGHLYEILNYQKGLSKEVIRKLAAYFKVSQEAFNKHYSVKKNLTRVAERNKVKAVLRKQIHKKVSAATKRKQKPQQSLPAMKA